MCLNGSSSRRLKDVILGKSSRSCAEVGGLAPPTPFDFLPPPSLPVAACCCRGAGCLSTRSPHVAHLPQVRMVATEPRPLSGMQVIFWLACLSTAHAPPSSPGYQGQFITGPPPGALARCQTVCPGSQACEDRALVPRVPHPHAWQQTNLSRLPLRHDQLHACLTWAMAPFELSRSPTGSVRTPIVGLSARPPPRRSPRMRPWVARM